MARLDCNQGRGGYTAAEGVLTLTPLALTTAICPPDSSATTVQRLLARATSYRFDPEWGASAARGGWRGLQLQPVLPGVVWQWQGNVSSTGEVTIHPDDPSQYTVAFLPDGTLAIQADGNHATGTSTLDRSQLDLQIGEYQGGVPARLTDRFLADLDQVVSYVFRDGKLYLALPIDAGILAFAPTAVVPPSSNTRRGMIGAPVPASNGSGCEVPGRRGARSGLGRAPVPRSCVSPY